MLIEVETVTLADGVEEADFLTADHKYQEELNSSSGLIRRTVARRDADWLLLTFWQDAGSADAATARLGTHAATTRLRDLVQSVDLRRYYDIGG